MNQQIIDEVYQLAGGEVPREMIEQIFSQCSPDEARELREIIRQLAADNPELIKTGIWNMVLTGMVQKGIHLLYNEKKPADALAELKKAIPYLQHTNDPEAQHGVYAYMVLAYNAKYENATSRYPGGGKAPQEEFAEIWNAYQKVEEIWPACERMNPPENLRGLHEGLLNLKPHYLYEALIRLEGYKEPEEISQMKFDNPEGALEELKKWFANKDELEKSDTSAAQVIVLGLCMEFLAACEMFHGESSNYPDEDFNYAWGAIKSLQHIANHRDFSRMPLPMSAGEFRQFLEQSYQQFSSEYSRRTGETPSRPQTQTQPQKSSGGCFIATAVYGSENASAVLVLRSFRDNVLLSSRIGRTLINLYYLISPPVARLLSANLRLRNMVRKTVVQPIVNLVCSKLYTKQKEEAKSLL